MLFFKSSLIVFLFFQKIFATDRKTLNEFHEEQSIEARNSVVNESPHQYKTNSDTKKSILSNKHSGVHVEKSILSNKHSGVHIEESILANKHSGVRVEKSILSNKHSGIHIEENYHYSTKLVEKKIQEQYKEPLVKKTKDRVEKMKLKMKEIHQDYEECLENIERNLEMKLDYEITLLIAEESELNQLSSQEMQKFQHMKMQRDLMVQVGFQYENLIFVLNPYFVLFFSLNGSFRTKKRTFNYVYFKLFF